MVKFSKSREFKRQHIITKPIFSHIFAELDFSKFDKVSFELDKLYDELGKFGLKSELDKLKGFYNSIQKTAEYAQSDKAKQDLIRNLYDSLFKSAFKKTQEKLGIVYTPIEVVDFIIHSVEFALQKHFGKSLSDKGVHILDPFTGTGSFITQLIQSGLLDANLAHKYKSELWANEITLLAYYIAQLNITSVFHEQFLRLKTADKSPALAKGDTQKSPSLAEGDLGGGLLNYRRKDGIRDEALCEIRRKYKDEKITKEDIFYYIYALLNHKGYKEKYKDNLSKMLPRIPFVKDFWGFCKIGRELAALHLNYENFAATCRAKVVAKGEYKEASGLFGKDGGEFLANLNEGDFRLEKMRFVSKHKRDTIFFNDKIAITQIPQSAYDYVVNGRSGVEWIMERYQVKTDKDSGIKNDPNLFECDSGALASGFDNGGADLTGLANSNGGVGGAVNVGFGGGSALSGLKGGKYALYLLLSVIEMSALSVEILDKLAEFGLDEVG